MTLRNSKAIVLAGIMAVALGAGNAFAAGASEQQEQTALMNTRLTLSDAIAAAEHQTGGKAFDAGADVDHGAPRVVVETNGPKGVQTVTVDAQNGHIVAVRSGGVPD